LSGEAKLRNVAALPRVTENKATMRIDQAVHIEDLHRTAKRKLPRIIFDFIEGGLEDERGLDLVMSRIGCPSLDQLGPDFLWRDDWQRNV
jgi:hypothetical protein